MPKRSDSLDEIPKVALLGPSGVGKTSLATRLSREEFVPETATIGLGIRPLFESTEAETLLLEARITGSDDPPESNEVAKHEFSAALVLVDPTRGEQAAQHLMQTATWLGSKYNKLPFRKFVVETRVDVGGRDDKGLVESLAERFNFDGTFKTSAKTGDGIRQLRNAILSAVEWQREQAPVAETEIEIVVRTLAESLCDLIARHPHALDGIEWRDLERVVAVALRELGFWVELTPSAKDGGKDIIARCTVAKAHKVYYVEIKHWKKDRPGAAHISHFIEVNSLNQTDGGLFLSSSGYTDWAHARVGEVFRHKVRLGDRNKIIALCQQYVRRRNGFWRVDKPLPELLFEETLDENSS